MSIFQERNGLRGLSFRAKNRNTPIIFSICTQIANLNKKIAEDSEDLIASKAETDSVRENLRSKVSFS